MIADAIIPILVNFPFFILFSLKLKTKRFLMIEQGSSSLDLL